MKKLLFLLVIVLTIFPFFHTGLFDVHDPTSAFRLYTLVETLKSGQFPAAWSNLLNFGYGYPIHLFYAPLFTYLGTLFVPLTGSYEIAVKISLFVASLVGTVGIYKLLRSYGTYPSILGAVAFTYLPYRASALYVRGSYAEFLAMSILPWVIYYWTKPQNSKKTILLTSIVTALFTLSHNTLPVLVAPIILLMIIIFQTKYLKGSALSLLATFGLSAWFILPIIFERDFVQVETVARLTDYRDHFLSLSQLWFSPWGYGGSAKGVEGDHMSFMIGKGQVILSLLGITFLIAKRMWKYLALFGFTLALSVFLSLPQSSALWRIFPILSVMQFPWRSLALVGVGVATLSGLSILFVPQKLRLIACIVLSGILIYTNLSYFHPQEYRNYNHDILSSQNNLDPLVRDKIPEYLPTWMPSPLPRKDDGLTRTSTAVYGEFSSELDSPIFLNTAFSPQWSLTVDGHHQAIRPDLNGTIITTGTISSGKHIVELTWHRTMVEQIGIWISALTIIVVVGLLTV